MAAQRGYMDRNLPYNLKGMSGALIQKVDEKDLYLFIPNLKSAKMETWLYKGKGPWGFLARMQDIGPKSY